MQSGSRVAPWRMFIRTEDLRAAFTETEPLRRILPGEPGATGRLPGWLSPPAVLSSIDHSPAGLLACQFGAPSRLPLRVPGRAARCSILRRAGMRDSVGVAHACQGPPPRRASSAQVSAAGAIGVDAAAVHFQPCPEQKATGPLACQSVESCTEAPTGILGSSGASRRPGVLSLFISRTRHQAAA
jgi:hypothetical protein